MRKPATEKGCLLEMERVVRLIVNYKQDKESLESCRKALGGVFQTIDKLRREKQQAQERKAAEEYASKMGFTKK